MVAHSGHSVADDLGADPVVRRAPMAMRDPMATTDVVTRRDPQIRRAPNAAGLYDVLDLILDKGMVIDAFVRVSLVGIELLTIDLRVVIASVDTYLRYAEGVDRLQIRGDEKSEPKSLPGMVGGGMKAHSLKQGAKSVGRMLTGGGEDEDEGEEGSDDNRSHGVVGALSKGVRRAVGRVAGALSGDPGEYEDDDEKDNPPPRHHHEHRGSPGRPRDREQRGAKAGGRH